MIKSDPFSSGGSLLLLLLSTYDLLQVKQNQRFCLRCLKVHPKGHRGHDDLILFLGDADPKSLRRGWRRRVRFCFVLLDQSGQELYRTPRNVT